MIKWLQQNTKIGIFLISVIRSMWAFVPLILPVIGTDCTHCQNGVKSKFHSFRETECKMIPVPIPLQENNNSICFCLTLLIKNTNNLHWERKSFLQGTIRRRVNTASQLGYLWQLKPLDSSRVVRAPWLITMPFISHSLITFSLRQEAPNPSHKAFRLVPCKINTCFYPL